MYDNESGVLNSLLAWVDYFAHAEETSNNIKYFFEFLGFLCSVIKRNP